MTQCIATWPALVDARWNFAGVFGRWYPVILMLHLFFIAISRAVVNHADGSGSAPDPLVWSAGALPKRRRLVHAVRDRAFLPGPSGIWEGEWISLASAPVTAEDVGAWPYSMGMLVKWVTFLGTLHWPAVGADLWVGGVSFVEVLIFSLSFGQVKGWYWKRLSSVIGGLGAQFQCRLFRLVQELTFGVPACSLGHSSGH